MKLYLNFHSLFFISSLLVIASEKSVFIFRQTNYFSDYRALRYNTKGFNIGNWEGFNMSAKAIFKCRPNSHPFQERIVDIIEPVKIGRAVARSRPTQGNVIFDCKVLSRNHALLWYEDGCFYLQDTKSSNGTFVNNQRLSKNAEESSPRRLFTGDMVQFGVDVMENQRRVTHNCIVATVELYHPDGSEVLPIKGSPFYVSYIHISCLHISQLWRNSSRFTVGGFAYFTGI